VYIKGRIKNPDANTIKVINNAFPELCIGKNNLARIGAIIQNNPKSYHSRTIPINTLTITFKFDFIE
jgi:hypothetical protein